MRTKFSITLLLTGIILISGCTIGSDPCAQHFLPGLKDKCLMDYAKEHKDPAVCEFTYLELSREMCYYDVAILTNDVELCKKIKSAISTLVTLPSLCFKTIAVNLRNETICEYTDNKWSYKDMCYTEIAKLTGNETICEYTSNTWAHKDTCYVEVAKLTENETTCEMAIELICGYINDYASEFISNYLSEYINFTWSYTDICYMEVAELTKNKTICDDKPHELICDYVSDKWSYTDICYMEVAKLTDNKTICNKIINTNRREECISSD